MTPISAVPPESDARLPEWLEVVFRNTSKLRFGSVQILVHDGRVTQVERVQRTRFVPAREEPRADLRPAALT